MKESIVSSQVSTQELVADRPFFLDFTVAIPESINLECIVQGAESIVYDGQSAKSVDD